MGVGCCVRVRVGVDVVGRSCGGANDKEVWISEVNITKRRILHSFLAGLLYFESKSRE
jgi:hypothetical protein